MISHKKKFIFIHTPKTGGRSIQKSLLAQKIEIDDSKQNVMTQPHLPNSWYREYYPEQYHAYFKFAFIRNPWDRFLSEYFYMQRWHGCDAKKHNVIFSEKYKTFRDFVLLNGIQYCWAYHDQPQTSIIDDEIDFVGRFEKLKEDFHTVCDKIGIRKPRLLHKNKSKHKHYTKYYDDETRQIVAEKFSADIDKFGYNFGE